VWDRVDGDLVERVVDGESAPASVLGATLVVAPADDLPLALRVAAETGELWATAEEDHRAAERRVAELEAELARLRKPQP
jgi:hypothetical protein